MDKNYIELCYMLNKLQWENYVENQTNDLNNICEQIYTILIEQLSNKEITLSRRFIRELIEKNTLVATIRNKLDDWDNYTKGQNIGDDELADLMYYDIIKLMTVRNQVAKSYGFKDYTAAILKSDNISKKALNNYLNYFIQKNLEKTNFLIEKYNIKWNSWFRDLEAINTSNNQQDAEGLLHSFAQKTGMLDIFKNIKITYGQDFCYATKVSANEINICMKSINSLNDIRTLFHEFGHAILYYYSCQSNIDNYFEITPCLDEVFAVIIENIAPLIALSKEEYDKINELNILEYTRTAISGLFELELWDNIDKANEIYIKNYSRLNINIENSNLWCLDSFRSVDTMYIYNYTLGQLAANNIVELYYYKYNKNNYLIGDILKNICYNINKLDYTDLLNIN